MLSGTSRKLASAARVAKSGDVLKKKKAVTAVYGCGLSASGALASPKLVVNDKVVTAREVYKPRRISHLNLLGIRHIAAGFGFSLFASKDKLFGAGLNNRFQITTHIQDTGSKPQDYYIRAKRMQLPTQPTILSVSSGRAHSLVATTAGVFAFGDNTHGQCGHDPEKYREVHGFGNMPLPLVEIMSDSPVTAVHCSLDTSFVLTQQGEVFSFGLNEDGQCANGSYDIQWKPARVLGDVADEKVVSISGSSDTILALSEKGDMFIWGQCEYGQAGLGIHDVQLNLSRYIPFRGGKIASVASTTSSCVASAENGEAYVWGTGLLGLGPNMQKLDRPALMDPPLFGNEKVSKVYAGNTSFGAVNSKGRLFVWGQNRFGLLGLEHRKDQYFPFEIFFPYDVKYVSLGPDHSLFLMK